MFTEEAVGSLVGTLCSLPPLDAAEERHSRARDSEGPACPDVRWSESALAVLESAGVRFGLNVLLILPNGLALRA